MKKVVFAILMFSSLIAVGQSKFFTKTGYIDFYSKSPMEDISAKNEQASSIFDAQTGKMVIAVLMKSFRFEKALMEEHFNENYVESDLYPKASFSGEITDFQNLNFVEGKPVKVTLSGQLSIHGVTRKVTEEGTITKTKDGYTADSQFYIKLDDYNVKIPSLVKDNISNNILITVKFSYLPMGK